MVGLVKGRVDLGPAASFTKFPSPISLGRYSLFLIKGKKGYSLLSAICPHQGGQVSDQGNGFLCRDHGWRFEYTRGECVNGPNARMISFPVSVSGGRLIADLG